MWVGRIYGQPALVFTRFARGRTTDRNSIWVASTDGSRAREITAGGYGGALSSDGRWLTFERSSDDPSDTYSLLFLVDLESGRTRALGKSLGYPRWSPAGARLAIPAPNGLFLIDASSGRMVRLLRDRVSSLDFAPDGSFIVFDASRGKLPANRTIGATSSGFSSPIAH